MDGVAGFAYFLPGKFPFVKLSSGIGHMKGAFRMLYRRDFLRRLAGKRITLFSQPVSSKKGQVNANNS
jgi:hypothetical protein